MTEAGSPREGAVAAVERQVRPPGGRLPADYRAWCATSDGVEGWFGPAFVRLFPLEEVATVTREFGAGGRLPGLVVIGGDGSRELFAYDLRRSDPPVVMIDVVASGWADAIVQATSFTEFLAQRHRGDDLRWSVEGG